MKVIAVIGFIILGIVIDCGGAPKGGYLGTHYWYDPGAFTNFYGFCSVFVTAAFAFSGTELAGLAAAEASNPAKSLPKATKQVFWRIMIFYVLATFIVGLIVFVTGLGETALGVTAIMALFQTVGAIGMARGLLEHAEAMAATTVVLVVATAVMSVAVAPRAPDAPTTAPSRPVPARPRRTPRRRRGSPTIRR